MRYFIHLESYQTISIMANYITSIAQTIEVGVLGRPMIRTRSVHRTFFNDTLQMHFYNILKSYAYQISLKDSYFHTLVTGKGYTKISIMANGICKYYLRYYFLGFIYALLEYSDLMSAQNISLYSLKYINTD